MSLDADGARRDGLAQLVDGLADVNSGIVGPQSSDVQGDESEIECAADAGAGHQLDAIVVPFDLQVRMLWPSERSSWLTRFLMKPGASDCGVSSYEAGARSVPSPSAGSSLKPAAGPRLPGCSRGNGPSPS